MDDLITRSNRRFLIFHYYVCYKLSLEALKWLKNFVVVNFDNNNIAIFTIWWIEAVSSAFSKIFR